VARREAIGLDIGTSAVRAANLSLKNPPRLERFAQVPVPVGAIREGEIVDVAAVSQAVAELWKRAGFKSKNVILGVANQKVVVRPIDLPYMDEKELRGAIQFQVQEYIPIPIEEANLDFQILNEFRGDSGERWIRVLVVAAQKDMINSFVETVVRAGLEPEAIDHIPFALIRSLGEPAGALNGNHPGEALVDIGAGVTNIVVHEQGTPRFARTLMVGGNAVTEALAAGLGVSFDDAESLKLRMGLSESVVGEGSPLEGAPRILEQRAMAFVDEVRGSLDYYLAQAEATRISRVVLSGGGSKLRGLPTRLANALRLPVEQGRVLHNIRPGKLGLSEPQLVEAEPFMGTAVGLAMGVAGE
jgi:type IV pilus assembly protein PilM